MLEQVPAAPDPRESHRTGLPLRVYVRRSAAADSLVRVETRLPSDVAVVEEAVELIVRHCLSGTAASQRFRFNLSVVLAESLANAIICGNDNHPDKSVDVSAVLRQDSIEVEITDEGDGFDPATVRDPTLAEDLEEPCGRGLFLIRSLADEVRFNSKGNSICLMLRRK
jgi:serine/threonine-protein kinase RsbW